MVVGLFPDLLCYGGIQQVGRHTAAVLAACARQGRAGYRFLSLNDPPGLHQVSVGDITFEVRGFGRAKLRFLASALRLALGRPRVVVAAHPNLAPIGWFMQALSPGLRALVVAHGVEVWTPLLAFRRWSLRRADLVLAPSTETARRLAAMQHVSTEKIRRLPWGLDPDLSPDAARAGATQPPAGFPRGRVILTVGRLSRIDHYKGIDSLIEVLPRLLSRIPDLHLVIVGEGDDRMRLEDLAKSLGLRERVLFLSRLPLESLVACYGRCDVFAMPSGGEGFGLVFLEAMALGKPVVGGAHGGVCDFVEDGVTGFLVRPGDLTALGGVLERLLLEEQLRHDIGQRAAEQVRKRFLFEHFRARLEQVIAELCAS